MSERIATVSRDTSETQITATINLDGEGHLVAATGVGFLDHMLDQIARHGLIDIELRAHVDLHIDAHHTVEDIGITLGQAFDQAIGDKRGIRRYGHAYVPLDEALSRVVIDFSGRPGLHMDVEFTRAAIGTLDTQLFWEFFQGFVNHARVTLHIDNLKGLNAHHPGRDHLQGLRPGAAHGRGGGPAHGRTDALDQGQPVNINCEERA